MIDWDEVAAKLDAGVRERRERNRAKRLQVATADRERKRAAVRQRQDALKEEAIEAGEARRI